jgi:hypothetical protein
MNLNHAAWGLEGALLAAEALSPSFNCVLIEVFWESDEAGLAVGSAFVVRRDEQEYLVTARHNFTGRDADGHLRSSRGVEPTRVLARFLTSTDPYEWDDVMLPLLDADAFPLWFEHPNFGRDVDVAVLPLGDRGHVLPAFDIFDVAAHEEPSVRVGDDLFVAGYPLGHASYEGLPIWIRASIASEPWMRYGNLPSYLIDAATTEANSGSAVILRPPIGAHVRTTNRGIRAAADDENWIAGVYSGRIDDRGLTVGVVWRVRAIIDIIQSHTSIESVAPYRQITR